MDEVVLCGSWRFGRKGDAYIAVHCARPYEAIASGPYKQRELLCLSKRTVWVFELGDAGQWGSFEAFVRAVSDAPISLLGESLVYQSPTLGECFFDWDQPCTVEGKPFLEEDFPLLENPYATSAYGSGLVRLRAPYRGAMNFF